MKNLDGEFEVKNFSCTYSLCKGNNSMESKIIEYRTTLLHKYYYHSLFYSQITRAFGQTEHLHGSNIFSYFFHSYDITTLGNIHPITF